MRKPRIIIPFIGALILFSVLMASYVFPAVSKDEVLSQYQETTSKIQKLENQGYPVSTLQTQMEQAVALAIEGDLSQSYQAMKKIESDLVREGNKQILPYSSDQMRMEWLEIYSDIFQKFAFIMIIAYFLVRQSWFRAFFVGDLVKEKTRKAVLLSLGALTVCGFLGSAIGYFRFGEADWAFLDLQVVFTVLCGFLGGIQAGVICGLIGGVLKYVLGSGRLVYILIMLLSGLCAGWFGKRLEGEAIKRRYALIAGFVSGLLHGLLIYVPLLKSLEFSVMWGIIISLAILESFSVYLFVAIALGVVQNDERKKLEKLLPEMKLKFLQAQINPHFLFNALNTIAAICSREKAEQARDLVVKLSNYFRRILKREDEFVTLEEEFQHIDSYLEIEKARYQSGLQIRKNIQVGPRGLRAELPVLIIQPIVENAIRHGVAPKPGGGFLEISAFENGKMVEILVKDNGVGIPPEKLKMIQETGYDSFQNQNQKAEGSGIGLKNINERLKYQFGKESQLKIESKVGEGTVIGFKFPIENEKEE